MKWTTEEVKLLKKNYKKSRKELITLFPNRTLSSIQSKAEKMRLFKKHRFYFQEKDDTYLREQYANTLNRELAQHLGCTIGGVESRAWRLKLKKTKKFLSEVSRKNMQNPNHGARKFLFKKGQEPPNKGKKQSEFMTAEAIERSAKTRFKKGNIPANHKKIGHKRINADGYIEVKTADPNQFELLHRYVWRKTHGEIPKGNNIQFKDGNKENCNIDNLYMISRKEQVQQNSIHRYPKDLKKAIRLNAKLQKQIKQLENETH